MFQVVSDTNNVVVKLRDQLLMKIWADLIAFLLVIRKVWTGVLSWISM